MPPKATGSGTRIPARAFLNRFAFGTTTFFYFLWPDLAGFPRRKAAKAKPTRCRRSAFAAFPPSAFHIGGAHGILFLCEIVGNFKHLRRKRGSKKSVAMRSIDFGLFYILHSTFFILLSPLTRRLPLRANAAMAPLRRQLHPPVRSQYQAEVRFLRPLGGEGLARRSATQVA
jgi:hypothetical protein